MSFPRLAAALLPALLLGPALVRAQEQPLTAGSDGVPVPKKKKHVQPVYPQEALAQGIRGIVILDLTINTDGRVSDVSVIRSIPGLDEAAVAAASQWEYEVTRVKGRPVSVRLTVPITFALKLPEVSRQAGIPELRQGVTPPWPNGAGSGGRATADVTLDPDGRIGVARILEGDEPWSSALIQALRTWRFAVPPEDTVISFRVEADFVPGPREDRRVALRLTGLRQSQTMASAPAAPTDIAALEPKEPEPETTGGTAGTQGPPPADENAAPDQAAGQAASPAPVEQTGEDAEGGQSPAVAQNVPPVTAQNVPPAAAPPPTPEGSPPAVPPAAEAAAPPAGAGEAAAPEGGPGPGTASSAPAPVPAPGTGEAVAEPSATSPPGSMAAPPIEALPGGPEAGATSPPPVEVITAAPPPLPPENGISALVGVTLEPGVPDLTQGRRPVSPPFARMARAGGEVEVDFSVGPGGATMIGTVRGPKLLEPAARAAVESWTFRRTRADRLYLLAVFTYDGDTASATVRPQPLP